MEFPLKGSCQCGQIRYEIQQKFSAQIICHCTECQKFTASAFGISALIDKKHFTLLKGHLKKFIRVANSGNENHCYFCAECGNRIYHVNPNSPDIIRLKPGTLDDTQSIKPTTHFWVQSKQDWVEIPNNVKQYQTQPKM